MKYILFSILFITTTALADRVGVTGDPLWQAAGENIQTADTDTKYQYIEESQAIGEEVVIPSNQQSTNTISSEDIESLKNSTSNEIVVDDLPLAKTKSSTIQTINKQKSFNVLKKLNSNQTLKKIVNYLKPLWVFAKENGSLFLLFITFLWSLFYLLFYRPLAKRVKEYDDMDISYNERITKSLAN